MIDAQERLPTPSLDASKAEDLRRIQAGFEAALPKMRTVMRFRMRGLSSERKDELMAEATAIAWANYLQLVRDGRDPEPLINKIAQFASRGVLSGRKLAGADRVNDVMSRTAKTKHGHFVQSLGFDEDDQVHPEVLASLRDHRNDSPAEEAIARIDHEEWVKGLSPRLQHAEKAFAEGLDNKGVAALEGTGRGTGSNLRKALRQSWAER